MLPPTQDNRTVPLQGVVQALVETITERILDGRYSPGFRLVEAELMRDLQAGRNSVREALRIAARNHNQPDAQSRVLSDAD